MSRERAHSTVIFAVVYALLLAFIPLAASAQSAGSSLLVKLVDGLSPALQADVIARNGGVERSVISALRLHVIDVLPSELDAVRANYQADPRVVSVEENRTRVWEAVPGDPLYGYQWALPRIAWDQVFGNVTPTGTAKVALLDTGVDALHPDLSGKVVPGTSILDGSNGMTDPSGHGTWLAGIIAAQTDNVPVEGIAGVAYAGVTVLPVTVLNVNGEGQDSDVIAGVIWAADHGADVILMAFSNPGFSPNLQDAIDYAWSKGIVLVAAVGNGAVSDATFPAGDRGVMGVAATDANDALAYFSNDGQAVFIAAPGVDITTTDIIDPYYVTVSGTSTSAAIVAGAAALMKAVDPTLTNGIIVGRLARNADPAGTQSQTGNGRINLARALADTSTEFIEPAGAAPVGAGGPFVGPYVAAAVGLTVSCSPTTTTVGVQTTCTANTSGNSTSGATITWSSSAAGTFNPTTCTLPAKNGSCPVGYTPSANGTQTITAKDTAPGDNNATGTFMLSVKGTTSTTITTNLSTATVVGQGYTVAVSVAVTAGSGTPTGTVQITDGTATCATGTLTSGTASCLLTSTTVGTKTVTATYGGDANFNGSTSAGVSHTVNQASTTTTITNALALATASVIGETYAVSYSVTVNNPGSGTPTGNVTVSDGTGAQCTATVAAGTCNLTSTSAGTKAITATYVGDTNFSTSTSATVTHGVNLRATSTAVSCTSPVVIGQATSCTATVSDTSPGTVSTPTGTMALSAAGAGVSPSSGNCTLSGSGASASCSVSFTGSTTGTITASTSYAGDTSHAASGPASGTATVNKRATSTSISCTSPAVIGQASSCTVTVNDTSPGTTTTPTGTITLNASGAGVSPTSDSCTLAGGGSSASCSLNFTGSTNATISLAATSYAGDTLHNGSTSGTASITVNKRATSTSVSCDTPVTNGQTSTCVATVTDTSPGAISTPSGTVNFTVTGATPTSTSCSLPAGSGASASCSLSLTAGAAGTASVSGNYGGDAQHNTSSGNASITIKRATTTTINCTPSTVILGQSTSCVVTVSDPGPQGGQNTPTGTVTVTAPTGTVTGSPCTLGGGGASPTCSVSFSSNVAGNVTVTAQYAGDSTHGGSSGTMSVSVKNPVPTTTSISPTSKTVGDAGFTLTVNGTNFISTSVVRLNGSDRATTFGSATQLTAAIPAGDLTTAGTFNITVFNPAPGGGTSNAQTFTVDKANTTTTVSSGTNPSAFNQSVTFTATVTVNAPGSGNPTGIVTFKDGATTLGTGTLDGSGHATFATSSLSVGSHSISATYGGDSNFNASPQSAAVSQTVNKADQTVTFGPLPNKVFGDPDFTVSATASSGLAIAFSSQTTGTCTVSGSTVHLIAAGACTIRASQAGDGNYNAAPNVDRSFTIDKAASTTTVSCPASVTYTGAAQTPCTASVTGAGGLNLTPTPTYTNNTDAGTATASYTFTGDANHTGSSDSKNFTINQASSSTTVSCPASVPYTGAAQTPCTVSVTGAGGLNLTPTPTYTNNTNAGTATASYTFTADANHTGSSDSKTFTIAQAGSTTTVTCPASVTYTGAAQTPCTASVTGAGGLNLTPTPTYTNNTNAGTATASYTFTGDANHTGSSDSKNFTINQASSSTTVSCPASVPYIGAAQTPCTVSVTGAGGLNLTPTPTYTNNTNAGTATASYTFVGDANHTGSSDSKTFTIAQAGSTTTVICPASVPYTGAVQTPCTMSVTGAGGLSLTPTPTYTNNTNAGTATASYTFAGDANHTGSSDSKTFTIEQASSTTAVVEGPTRATYTATVSPVAPATTTPTGTVQFSIDATPIGGPVTVDGNGQATSDVLSTPETAGAHTISAVYSGDTNFKPSTGTLTDTASAVADDAYATAQTSTLVVGKPGVLLNDADADSGQTLQAFVTQGPTQGTLTLKPDGSFTYVPAPGVAGLGTFTFQYSVFDGVLYSPAATVTITVLAGNEAVVALNDAYSVVAGSSATLPVLANDHGTATLTAAVVANEGPRHGTLTPNSDGSFTYTPTNGFAGVDSFLYEASDGTNTSNPAMVTITVLAAANTAAVNDYELTTDGTASGNVLSNDAGRPTAAAVMTPPVYGTLVFAGDGTFSYTPGLDFADVDSFTYLASGGTNAGNLAMVTIRKPVITVSGGPVTYGSDATITVTVTIPGQGPAAGSVALSAANATVAAPTSQTLDATGQATFTITQPTAAQSPHALTATYTNPFYSGSSVGTGSLVVNKATPTINWATPADITYGTALSGTQLNATATFKNNPVAGTFTYTPADGTVLNAGQNQNLHVDFAPTDSANFNGASKNVSINVTQAALTVTANDQTKTYADPNPTFTVSRTGFVNGDGAGTLGGTLAFNFAGKPPTSYGPSTVVPTDAGTYAIRPSGLTSSNYAITFKAGTYTINQATSTTTVSCLASVTYDGTAQTPCTASVTGAGGLSQALTVSYTNNTNAGTATASASYAGDANHTGSSDSKNFTIAQAGSTTTVTCPASVTYDGTAQTPCTASVTGAGGLKQALTVSYTNNTNAGTATASASYPGDANHTGSSDSKNFTIDKASSTTTVTFEAGPYTYRGTAFTATAMVTGEGGLSQAVAVVYSGDCTNVTSANGCTATATFGGDTNHNGSSDSKSITITKADPTVTATGNTCTYDGTPCAGSGSATGVLGEPLTPVTVAYSVPPPGPGNLLTSAPVNAGTYLVAARFAGNTNYNAKQSAAATITINQATSTTTVTCPASVPYTGAAQTPCTASVTGAGGLSQALTVSYANNTNAGTATASASYAGDANHTGSSNSKTFTIEQASSTTAVVAGTTRGTYTATVSPVAPATTTPTGTVQFSIDGNPIGGPVALDGSGHSTSVVLSTPETAGLHTISAVYSGDTNYTTSTGTLTDTASAVADDAYATLQSSTLVVGKPGVLLNDADADSGQTLQAFVTQQPVQGTLTLNIDGSFTYVPAPGGAGLGVFTFKYSVFDGVLYSPEATVTITVLEGNESTMALNDAYSVTTGSSVTLPVLANDHGTATLTATVVANEGPRHGTLMANADGSYTYTPTPGFTGVDSFQYQASDGTNLSNVAMVTITVLAADNTEAVNDYYLTSSPVSGNVLSNDDGGPTAAAVVTPPVYGTVSFPGNGTFTYTPGLSFADVDSFTYLASGGTNAGNLATATIRHPVITVTAPAVTYGSDATVTVTVTIPGHGPAAGSVALSAANATVAPPTSATLDQNGQATFTITQPTAADSPHALTATYTNAAYNGSSTGTGSLTVTKATPTINWANPGDITYGTALSGTQLNATATFKNNSVAGTFTYTPTDGTVLNAGQNQNLHVDFVPTDSANFNGASKNVSINVTQAALTVTANDQTKTYADPNPTFTVSYTGFVNGDGAGTLGGTLAFNFAGKPPTSYGPSTVVPTDAGTYAIRPSGLTSSNYAITFKGGTYTINQASLTITPDGNKSKVYGQTFTAFTGIVVGLKGSDQVTVTYTSTGTAATAAAGSYDITVDTVTFTVGSASNYAITKNVATNGLTVNKAPLTVTANDKTKTYFDPDPTFDVSYSGFVNGDGAGTLGGTLAFNFAGKPPTSYGPSMVVPTDAGTYAIRPSGLTSNNYDITFKGGTYTINKAASTTVVTFEAGPYAYRATAFTATAVVTGVGGLNSPVAVVYSGDCTNVTGANGCTATGTYAGDTNHLGSSDIKSITITQAPSTTVVTFEAGAYVYRASAFTATAQVTGVGGLNSAVAVVYSGDCTNVTVANGCTATATYAGDTNHLGSSDSKSITITKASSTTVVTFEVGPYVYRATAFTATAVVTGVGGLNSPVAVVYSGDCTNVSVNNGCTATATFGGDGNHLGSSDSKSITITKASSTTTVTFESGPYTYRSSPFTATAWVTGVGGLNAPVTVVYSGDCTNVTVVNGCTATATYAGDTNHNGSSDSKSITINKKTASVTPNAASKTYGDPDPTLTGTLSGFLAVDNVTATYSRTAGETVAGGPYTISAALSPAGVLGNYTITYNTANFTITQKAASVTPNAASKTYGSPDPALTGTRSGFLAADNVTATYSRTAGETVAGGPYTISAALSPAGVLGNYTITYNTANFMINKAMLTVTADNKSKVLNAPNPVLTASFTGFKNGETLATSGVTGSPSLTTTATTTSPVGSYPISTAIGTLSAANYSFTFVNGSLAIQYATAGLVCNGEPGHQILQPINSDNTSVFKLGSTVPTKFRVCDTNGVSVGTAGVVTSYGLIAAVTDTALAVDESQYSTTPDTAFRWDSSAQQWIFNQSTKNNPTLNKTNTRYYFRIYLNDGTWIDFQYGLK